MNTSPIIYDYTLDLRFNDLDPYGHLNSSNYLDLVSSSRLLFIERELKKSVSVFAEKGFAFFMTKATQEFLKPVGQFDRVRICSHVAKPERFRLTVPYEMTNPEKSKTFSRGTLEFVLVTLSNGRPASMPEWMLPYFFE